MKKRNSGPIDDDFRLTPDQERQLEYSIVQSDAGLTFGPFETKGLSLQTFFERSQRTRRVSLKIPAVLFTYLKHEAKRFGISADKLMVLILETHKFKDRDHQMIMLAVEHASRRPTLAGRGRAKRSRKK